MSMPDSATPLAATLTRERERWVLWVPVALLAGISSYFTLSFEPWPFTGLAIALVGLLLTLLPYRTPGVRLFFLAVMFCGVGFALVQWETVRSDGPILRSEVGPRMVSGTISVVEPRDKGVRLTLDDPVIDWMEPQETPRRIRITVRTHGGIEPVPGQRVRILAILDAPPPRRQPRWFPDESFRARRACARPPVPRVRSVVAKCGLWSVASRPLRRTKPFWKRDTN